MNLSLRRYTDEMLLALGRQSIPSIALNAFTRGVLFTALIQLISFSSGLGMSNILQIVILIIVFTLITFSIDLIEKYWAQNRLSKRV